MPFLQSIQTSNIEIETVNSKLKAPVLLTLLALSSISEAELGGMCDEARSKMELLRCEEMGLDKLEIINNETYKLAHQITTDKAKLKDDQQKWERNVLNRCNDKECIEKAFTDRIALLEGLWRKSRFSSAVKADMQSKTPFEGHWKHCDLFEGKIICSSFSLIQTGNRICGDWDYWATYRTYSGQFQAHTTAKNEAVLELTCGVGDLGSEANIECNNKAKPSGFWAKSSGLIKICDGRLYWGKKTCDQAKVSESYIYEPINAKEKYAQQDWIKECLSKK